MENNIAALIQKHAGDIYYSDKYFDDTHEYRHVLLPKELAKIVPKDHLMSEAEWRSIGVQQSRGWQHYLIHEPEPHVLLFRRAVNFGQPQQLQAKDQNKMSARVN
ncbi:Cyclin-dependent kinases regulatory subunit [Brachionus plicatilis]|uniref:Cyclin-dependent kinases regulatory subunit n=1 Tax=Brachionus plicatilis TaxID=10195 RepID=A0A3M7RAZ8_BRAPC|nr:Cyclin-dependent kinases regulatory subunit [Brachionus plicatilis]